MQHGGFFSFLSLPPSTLSLSLPLSLSHSLLTSVHRLVRGTDREKEREREREAESGRGRERERQRDKVDRRTDYGAPEQPRAGTRENYTLSLSLTLSHSLSHLVDGTSITTSNALTFTLCLEGETFRAGGDEERGAKAILLSETDEEITVAHTGRLSGNDIRRCIDTPLVR